MAHTLSSPGSPTSQCCAGGKVGGSTPRRVTREEVIAFGGIPDPVSVGRQLSYRLQDHSEVDDI
mgnify:CR=1 FL=1